jgi:hypothetical protein
VPPPLFPQILPPAIPEPTSVEAEFTVEQGEALIRQLGASKFERREQAMAEIIRIGIPWSRCFARQSTRAKTRSNCCELNPHLLN